jgi:large subunit ribosomal protein L35
MPKLKTKSGAKKRFKMTATGKVKVAQAGKRHGMIKRTPKFIRNARGMTVLSAQDAAIVKIYMPYSR